MNAFTLATALFVAHGHLGAGRDRAALEAADDALATLTAEEAKDATVATAAAALESIAFNASHHLGNFPLALRHASRELEYARASGMLRTLVTALNNRAVGQMETGDLVGAERDLREALQVVDAADDLDDLRPHVLSHLALLDVLRGKRHHAEVELPPLSRTGFVDADVAQLNIRASTAAARGDRAGAIAQTEQLLRDSAKAAPKTRGIVLSNLGLLYAEDGRDEDALRTYREAREVLSAEGCEEPRANVLYNLGMLHEQRNENDAALDCYKSAWDLIRVAAPQSPQAMRVLYVLARRRLAMKDQQRARSALVRAMELYEELRPRVAMDEPGHAGLFDLYRRVAELLLYLSISESWMDEALQIVERAKARFWIEQLERAAGSERGAAFRQSAQLAGVPDQVETIGLNGLAIHYFVGTMATFVIVAQNSVLSGHRLDVTEPELQERVDAFLETLGAEEGEVLARLLFGRIQLQQGVPIRHLYVLPDGPLWRVPFDALPFRTADALDGDCELTCEIAPTTIAPSLSIIRRLNLRGDVPPEQRRFVLIGNPAGVTEYPPLPGAAHEMEVIARLVREQSTIIEREKATKAGAIAAADTATHIHFATHAAIETDAALVLTGGELL
ncbi:MAG: CHAT domain-containing protein, partial [Thermoanaerobaculia bacterium]